MRLYHGDVADILPSLPENHFDAVFCDPPYGLSFMGQAWDYGIPPATVWGEILRVCKPGAHLLAFGGARTFHRLVCAVEDAGWQVRDVLMWVYGSGFPKSFNLTGDFRGFGTALKPAYEPILLARKPLDGTVAQNVQAWGCGTLWIDGGRIDMSDDDATYISDRIGGYNNTRSIGGNSAYGGGATIDRAATYDASKGRWPANVLHDGLREEWARYFYCAKASACERCAGLNGRNPHPTVKPLNLCRYLAGLILPPAGRPQGPRRLLVPFSGSGSEMIGALTAGWDDVTGIEREAEYVAVAHARLDYWTKGPAEAAPERPAVTPRVDLPLLALAQEAR